MILDNGATPIKAHLDFTSEVGMVAHRGFVLAQRGKQFVTWECGKEADDVTWYCESGHYFDKLEEAEFDFGLRVGRELDRNKNGAMVRGIYSRLG